MVCEETSFSMLRTFRRTGLITHGPVEPSPLFGTGKKVVSCLLHSVLEAAACWVFSTECVHLCPSVVLRVHSRSPAQHVNTFVQAKERARLGTTLCVASSNVFKAVSSGSHNVQGEAMEQWRHSIRMPRPRTGHTETRSRQLRQVNTWERVGPWQHGSETVQLTR